MKVTSQKAAPDFEPQTILVTLETQDELDAFYQIFNSVAIDKGMTKIGLDSNEITDSIMADIKDTKALLSIFNAEVKRSLLEDDQYDQV